MTTDNNQSGSSESDVSVPPEVEELIPKAVKNIDRRGFLASSASMFGTVTLAGCSWIPSGSDGEGGSPAGESNDNPDNQGATLDNQLHFLCDYNTDAWKSRWQKLIPQFEAEMSIPMNLEYTGVVGSGGTERLANLYQTGNPPDLVTGIPDQYMDIIGNGDIADLGDVKNTVEEEVGPYNKNAIARHNIAGQWIMVPTGVFTQTINYPTDALDQLGMDKPETREDLLNVAEAITEDSSLPPAYALSGTKTGKSSPEFLHYLMNGDSWIFEWNESGNYDLSNLDLTFPEEDVVELLEFYQQLAEYSIDPSVAQWGKVFGLVSSGQVAMSHMANVWPLGIAIKSGNTEVVDNYDFSMFPKKKGATPPSRGYAEPDGVTVLETDIADDAKTFIEWWLGDLERNAQNFAPDPTRFLPVSKTIAESDTYTNLDVFKDNPRALELNQQLVIDVLPELSGPKGEYPYTAVLGYIRRFNLISELVNLVLVQDTPPRQAYRTVRPKIEKRFNEGIEKFGDL